MDPENPIPATDPGAVEPGGVETIEDPGARPRSEADSAQAATALARSAQQSIVVERPLTEVFAFASDLARRCRWQRGTRIGELADPEVAELGAQCTETRGAPNGASEQWDMEVVAFELDGLLTIRAECGCAQMVERHVFAADPSGIGRTRYSLSLETSGMGRTVGDLQRQIVDYLIHLRDCLENPDAMEASRRWSATRLRRKGDETDPTGLRQAHEGGSTHEPDR